MNSPKQEQKKEKWAVFFSFLPEQPSKVSFCTNLSKLLLISKSLIQEVCGLLFVYNNTEIAIEKREMVTHMLLYKPTLSSFLSNKCRALS